jgi:LacI family transcriptional regulator
MATIKDIANKTGYSIGTVSRVINNHPDVSEKARKIIQTVIDEENFRPNSNAKLLKQTIPSSIIIYVKGTHNIFLEGLLEKIQKALRDHGESAGVVFLDESADEVKTAIREEAEKHPKGLIFLGGSADNFRKHFASVHAPSVLVTGNASDMHYDNLSSFSTDDYDGSAAAAELLIRFGHQKIGVLGGHLSVEKGKITSPRLKGFADTLAEHNIPFNARRQFTASRFSMEDGYEAMKKLLKKFPGITAVFAHSDMIAVGAMRAIHDAGKRIPEDISLIGYDGIEYSDYTVPRIATIRQDTDTLSRRSVEDLLMRISYSTPPVHETVQFEVLEKESVSSAKTK